MSEASRLGLLVGVDGSEESLRAADWATAEAPTDVPITLCHVTDFGSLVDLRFPPELVGEVRGRTGVMLDQAAERVHRVRGDVRVGLHAREGRVAAELLRLASRADAVVLGSRGRGGFGALLLGSVSAQVAAHAPVPVVIVRGENRPAGPVLVGVAGPDDGHPELEYAFRYAARHGLGVQAVHAFDDPMTVPGLVGYPADRDFGRARLAAERGLQETLAPWVAKYPDAPVERVVLGGRPARNLVDASLGASLLVVGSRGHGGVAGLLLGSVSQAVLQRARCPVVVAH